MNNAAANAAVGTAPAQPRAQSSARRRVKRVPVPRSARAQDFCSVAMGADYAGFSSYQLQRQYDVSYVQCMYARGNRVPARFVYRGPPRRYAPAYAPDYRLPDDAPPDYRPPGHAPPNYPPPRG